jgi:hypothetical protein
MTNNKQQTAVEWQHIELMRINFEYATSKITPREFQEQTKYIFEQAKAMHKEEIKSTFYEGAFRESCESGQRYKYVGEEDAEKFYNETYGGK